MTEERKPIADPRYWHQRLMWAAATGRGTHTAIYDTDGTTWQKIQNETKVVLHKYLVSGMSLLDAGCGYGAVSSYVPEGVRYVGLDLSPDLLEVARIAYPQAEFVLGNLASLPQFTGHQFDFSLCRSIRRMVIDNQGEAAWDAIAAELLRVSRSVILVEYEDLPNYQMLLTSGKLL